MPITVTFAFFIAKDATSIPINEDPMITRFFLSSPFPIAGQNESICIRSAINFMLEKDIVDKKYPARFYYYLEQCEDRKHFQG